MANRKIEVEIVGDSKSLERAFRKSGDAGEKFGRKMRVGGRQAAAGIGLAAAAIGGIAIAASKAFSGFEDSMNKIVGLVGVSRDQVDAWQESLLKLGPEVAKSPKELADALFFVTSAGLRGQKALDALSVAAHASAAGLGETKTVADAITSAINAYGAANLTAAQAGDVLVATVREGKVSADSLAPVIGNLAAFASALGVSFDQVGAALAAQTRITGDAKSASTQLGAIFSTIAKGAPKTVKGFKAVGLNIDNVRDTLKKPDGLLKVLKQLGTAFKGNIKAQAQAFPNLRALRGILALVGKSGDQTIKIFNRMKDSTGSVGKAFKAISEDEGFQFERTLESLKVVGIRLGAILEPVANTIARTTTNALNVVSDFLKKLGEAKTVKAKINVIFQGVKTATKRATTFLQDAFKKINWDEVWASAKGVADGFQKQLESADFAFIGKKISASIKGAVNTALPAAKDLAQRLTDAMRAIDFEALGREIGPGLATAVVTGFLTLADPVFWVRNWDLALSVAAVAFGGSLGRLAGKLAAPLVRLGGELVAKMTPALIEGMLRLPNIIGRAIVGSVRLIIRAVSGLTRVLTERFNKLGKIAKFTIKVLGVLAVINTITRFVKNVASIIGGLVKAIPNLFTNMWNKIKRGAIRAALEIIEPFTHIPGFLGGGAFQDLKAQWQGTLATMEANTTTSVAAINSSLDNIARNVVVSVTVTSPVTPGGRAPFGPGQDRGGQEGSQGLAGAVKVATDNQKKDADQAANNQAAAAKAVRQAAARAAASKKAAIKAFGKLMEGLSLTLDKAAATKSFKDDLAILELERKAVLAEIKIEGHTADLDRQLFDIIQQRAQARKDQQAAIADTRKTKQFKGLGLTADGSKPTPSVGALAKRLGTLKGQIKGTILDTPKTQSQLKKIGQVLSGKFGKVGQQVRAAILGMLNDISSALDSSGQKGPLTKFAKKGVEDLIAGLGLTEEQVKLLRSRMAQLGPGGAAPGRGSGGAFGFGIDSSGQVIVVNTTVNLDGAAVAKNTTKHQQKAKGRNAPGRRGPRR